MIDLEHVSKEYKRGGPLALDDINLHVDDGEFVFLLGHSGAGKSTLLKLLLREELPSEGKVTVLGKDVASLHRHQVPYLRRQMGIIFQASLLVLVPLVGGTVLLSRQQLRTQLRQAARSESGVPIQLPKTTDQLTVLLCVSGEQPGFVLAYLNASQNCVHLLSVPAVLTVPFAEEETSLARCYSAAGPARCREALAQVLALPEGTRYLAFSPDVLERIASRYGPVRVGFTGALTEEELARYGRSRAVQGISAGDAHEFLCQLQADEAFSPVRTAAARAAVWDAFLRQDLDLLPATLPDALRASSSALLTDLTALDYDALERTLEFLANNNAAVAAQALPGQWNAASGTYTVTDASRAAMQTFFNVSPTEAQASSFSEP